MSLLRDKDYWKVRSLNDPQNGRLYHVVAPIYSELGDAFLEMRHRRMAVKHDPENADARNDLGLEIFREGRIRDAEDQFLTALNYQPKSIAALVNMSAVRAHQGQYADAQRFCQMAIDIDRDNALAHRNLAKVLNALGDVRRSIRHNETAFRLADQEGSAKGEGELSSRRVLAGQIIAMGQNEEKCAHKIFDEYRKLKGDGIVLSTSKKTAEILRSLC